VQAADAERQYEREKTLNEQSLVSQAEADTAQTTAAAAQAQVEAAAASLEQARAALHQAEINLSYTNIVSPIDGVVVSRNVDVGQTVAAALQSPTLFLLAQDLRTMQVDTNVSETDVGKLRAGMPARFTVDAYPGEPFHGTVRQIRHAPQTLQNVVTYDAVLDVDNGESKLEPGMTANVTFIYSEKVEVLRIPNGALRFRPSPEQLSYLRGERDHAEADANRTLEAAYNRRSIWVLRSGEPYERTIVTGVTDGTFTEIKDGALGQGDTVITDVTLVAPQRFRLF
jgi:HlyD family secretion protein